MKLDLRFNARMHTQFSEVFNDISYLNRKSFNDFIDTISRPLIKNLDWWAESPASRNTYACPLFHYFCCVNFILNIFPVYSIYTIMRNFDCTDVKLLQKLEHYQKLFELMII